MNQLADIIKQHKNTINTLNFQIKQNKGVTDNIINEKKNRINNLIQECETLKKDVTSKNENINQLNIESVQLKTEFDQLKTECETLKKEVTSKNENINQLNIESVQLKTEFDQLKTECETLKEEVNQLKEDVSIVDNLKENNVSFKKVGPFIICK